MFNTLNKKIFEDKFINLLVEKRVHPSYLLKLTQELDAEKVINEAWHNKIEQPKHGSVFGALGRGLTGALGGALKGGLRGLVQGLQTGYGSAPIETSKAQLKSDLKSAYTEFSNKIERITGDSGLAHIIFTNLNQNVDKLIGYSYDKKDIERKDLQIIDIDNYLKRRDPDLVKKPFNPMEYINKPINNFVDFLGNRKTENKNFDDKFVDLLVEKRVHPLYLLKLTQEISSGRLVNEGFLGDLGNAISKGFKQGLAQRGLGYRTKQNREKEEEEEEKEANSKNKPKSKPDLKLKLPKYPEMPSRTTDPSLSNSPSRSIRPKGGIFRALGGGLTGALGGAVKGGLRGLVQGLEAGYGTAPFDTSLEVLRNNLKSAYLRFREKITRFTDNERTATKIYEILLNNSERLIDFAILQGKTTTEIPDSIERADAGSDTSFSLGNQATDRYQFYNTAISNESPSTPSTKTISGLGSSGRLSPEEEQEALKLAARRGTVEPETEIAKFPDNLKKLYSHIFEKIASHSETEGMKDSFNFLQTLQVIKRLDGHIKNHSFLGDSNYKSLIDQMIRTFEKNNCDLTDDLFLQNLIEVFDMVYDKIINSSAIDEKSKKIYTALRSTRNNGERPWEKFGPALTDINKMIGVFCDQYPDKCSSIRGASRLMLGSRKLLGKLEENKNITFSDWLLIKENILF
jgi:hypothetical protein